MFYREDAAKYGLTFCFLGSGCLVILVERPKLVSGRKDEDHSRKGVVWVVTAINWFKPCTDVAGGSTADVSDKETRDGSGTEP
jgi:hypothetical protein